MEEETCLHRTSHCTVFLLFMAFTTVLQITRRGLDLWAKQETKAHLHLSARSQQNAPSPVGMSAQREVVWETQTSALGGISYPSRIAVSPAAPPECLAN